MPEQPNNVGRGPLGVPTNSPISDPGTSARIQNRPNVPVGTAAPHHDGRKLTARLGGNREQGTDRFPVLKLGSRGGDVQRLQRLLNLHLESDEQLKVDGNFAQTTREAVLEFQKEEDLKPDGVVGRDTWFSLISAGTQEASWKAKPPAPPTKVVATSSTTSTKKTVDQWTLTERFEYVLQHCGPYLAPDIRAQFTALLTPMNLGIMVGSLVVWAGGHFFGVSEIADAFLLGFGLVFLGKAAIDAARLLKNVIEITSSASTEAELEDAAKDLAEAIAIIGVMTFFALLAKVARAIGNKLKAGEGGGAGGDVAAESQAKADATAAGEARRAQSYEDIDAHQNKYAAKEAEARQSGENRKAGGYKSKVTEAVGERAATEYMENNNPDFVMDKGFKPGSGFDQVYTKYDPAGNPVEMKIVEAKGPGAELSTDAAKGPQMSQEWVENTVSDMVKSDDPATRALGQKLQNALDTGEPPVTGTVIQAVKGGGAQEIPLANDAVYNGGRYN